MPNTSAISSAKKPSPSASRPSTTASQKPRPTKKKVRNIKNTPHSRAQYQVAQGAEHTAIAYAPDVEEEQQRLLERVAPYLGRLTATWAVVALEVRAAGSAFMFILREWGNLVRLLLPLLESPVPFFYICHTACKGTKKLRNTMKSARLFYMKGLPYPMSPPPILATRLNGSNSFIVKRTVVTMLMSTKFTNDFTFAITSNF